MTLMDVMTNNKNAMKAFDYALRISTANMGNIETAGYKGMEYSFQTIFNQVMSTGTGAAINHENGGTNPIQFGSGVAISGLKINFDQGDITDAGQSSAAILGEGLFVIQGDDGRFLYTRSGDFHFDNNNYLVDSNGRKVFGYKMTTDGQPITSELVPIKLDASHDAGFKYQSKDGVIIDNFSAYKTAWENKQPLPAVSALYQLAMTTFPNRSGLLQYDGTAFKETVASGKPLPFLVAGQGYGDVYGQSKEKSNVFYIGETMDALSVQRAMSASLTAIKIANQQIQTIIQHLGT